MAEHRFRKAGVVGSNPTFGSRATEQKELGLAGFLVRNLIAVMRKNGAVRDLADMKPMRARAVSDSAGTVLACMCEVL